jgi:hypothetical protein
VWTNHVSYWIVHRVENTEMNLARSVAGALSKSDPIIVGIGRLFFSPGVNPWYMATLPPES